MLVSRISPARAGPPPAPRRPRRARGLAPARNADLPLFGLPVTCFASMAQRMACEPDAAALVMSDGSATAAEFTDTLSAPAAIIVRMSATLRKPPPTQYGRCSCSLARLARSTVVARSSPWP